jgi:hypothetical protein
MGRLLALKKRFVRQCALTVEWLFQTRLILWWKGVITARYWMLGKTCRERGVALGESGGILTQPLLSSYHLFSNMHETSMNIGDFYDLYSFNSFNPSA